MSTFFPGYRETDPQEFEVIVQVVPPLSDSIAEQLAKALVVGGSDYHEEDCDTHPARQAYVTGNNEDATTIWATPAGGMSGSVPDATSMCKDALRIARRLATLHDPLGNAAISDEVRVYDNPYAARD